ncbi:hypothetical protein [Pseudodesulfovibrio tunisiensis]|uniref:hypothetical protein n=1 Tax=Pseudodesulfovibrio tunisiensis TaxID=463192 RepID=UPI001FB21703|nr:hypothetical protein [Pseudodesulfovibrio tunisiensis]
MDMEILDPTTTLPVERAYAVCMTIRSFKGRRNVDLHLFRSEWPESEEAAMPWDDLIVPSDDTPLEGEGGSRKIVMESFTQQERDRIVNYLKEQYSTRITAIRSVPLEFPVPAGLPALSDVQPGKSVGIVQFRKIPSYSLELPLCGLYDLSQHEPIVDA